MNLPACKELGLAQQLEVQCFLFAKDPLPGKSDKNARLDTFQHYSKPEEEEGVAVEAVVEVLRLEHCHV